MNSNLAWFESDREFSVGETRQQLRHPSARFLTLLVAASSYQLSCPYREYILNREAHQAAHKSLPGLQAHKKSSNTHGVVVQKHARLAVEDVACEGNILNPGDVTDVGHRRSPSVV